MKEKEISLEEYNELEKKYYIAMHGWNEEGKKNLNDFKNWFDECVENVVNRLNKDIESEVNTYGKFHFNTQNRLLFKILRDEMFGVEEDER